MIPAESNFICPMLTTPRVSETDTPLGDSFRERINIKGSNGHLTAYRILTPLWS